MEVSPCQENHAWACLVGNHASAHDKGASIGRALAKCTKLGKVHFSRARKIGSVVRSHVSEDMSSKRKVHLTKPFYSKKYIFEYFKKNLTQKNTFLSTQTSTLLIKYKKSTVLSKK